jgi:hypothetical protein
VYAGGMVVLCQPAVSRKKRQLCVWAGTDGGMRVKDNNVDCATDDEDDESKES